MDGVLIDSEPVHCKIEKIIFDQLGIVVPDDLHRNYLGASNEFMYQDLKSRFNLTVPVSDLLERDEILRVDFMGNSEIKLNEGVFTLLNEIKSATIKLAVATSSSPAIAKILLDKCGISSLFDAIVTTQEAGRSKPEPDVFLLAAQRVNVIPANCIVFEDSPNGILAAKGAGMYCVAIQTDGKYSKETIFADYCISSFREINLIQLLKIFTIN